MKLLLTSAGWKKNPSIGKEFLKLVDKKPSEIRVFVVITPNKSLKINVYTKRLKEVHIQEKNITFFQLDRKVNKDELKNMDVVFVCGGNTFDYLDGIRKTGLDKLIKSFVKKGGVYLGVSAGSYVACPTIEAASWKHADRNTIGLKNLKGLNLVTFLIVAHFEKEPHSIIEAAAQKTKYPVIAISDKQAVLINDKEIMIIGSGKINTFNLPCNCI